MTTRRNIKLSRKREAYVEQRSAGKLVGGALRPSQGQIDRYSAAITALLRVMYREYRRELVATFDETPPIIIPQDDDLVTELLQNAAPTQPPEM